MKNKNINIKLLYSDDVEKFKLEHDLEISQHQISGFLLKDGDLLFYGNWDYHTSEFLLRKRCFIMYLNNTDGNLLKCKDLLKYEKFDLNLNKISNFQFLLKLIKFQFGI